MRFLQDEQEDKPPVSVTGRLWQTDRTASGDDLVADFLRVRGYDDQTGAQFLNPTLKDLMPNPNLIAGLEAAAERLAEAIAHHQSIGILADFDVDGASSAALMHAYCGHFGVRPIVEVPDRLIEGFGPNERLLEAAVVRECALLFILDCGTAAVELLSGYHNRLEMIVIDHHQPEASLPKVTGLVNPQCSEAGKENFGNLAAVGVVFMVLVATNRKLAERGLEPPNLKRLLDLVALGTVCDMVPLLGLNRAFVHRGLELMSHQPRTGLEALIQISGVKSEVSAEDLSFLLGPRLNAGSRQGYSSLAWQLLAATDSLQAKKFAQKLHSLNRERKQASLALAHDAEQQQYVGKRFILAAQEGWPVGILGILAGNLSRREMKPTFVIGYDTDGEGSGSARSVAGIDLAEVLQGAVQACVLARGGGHARAGGFGLHRDQQAAFIAYLEETFQRMPVETPILEVDFFLPLQEIRPTVLRTMKKLQPFGMGNPEPLILLSSVTLRDVALMGTEHLRLQIVDGYQQCRAVVFGEARSRLGQFLQNQQAPCDLLVRIKADFRNPYQPCLHIEDARGKA